MPSNILYPGICHPIYFLEYQVQDLVCFPRNLYSLALSQLNANHLKVNGRIPPQGFTLLLTGQFTCHFRQTLPDIIYQVQTAHQSHSNIRTHSIPVPKSSQSQSDKHPMTPTTQGGRGERLKHHYRTQVENVFPEM